MTLVKKSELALLTGERYSTIKYYAEMGLLPYEQKGPRLARYYKVVEAVKRLKEIKVFKQKGWNIEKIKKYYLLK